MDIRLIEPQRHRAVLIDEHADREQFLQALLLDRGIVVIGRYATVREATAVRQVPDCDLLIIYLRALAQADFAPLKTVADTYKCPLLVLTETDDHDGTHAAIQAGANAVLCIGASSDRLRSATASAIAQFEQIEALKLTAMRAEQDLEDRKLIERAKSILMHQRSIAEPDAFRELQQTSMNGNKPLAEVARTVIAAKELLG